VAANRVKQYTKLPEAVGILVTGAPSHLAESAGISVENVILRIKTSSGQPNARMDIYDFGTDGATAVDWTERRITFDEVKTRLEFDVSYDVYYLNLATGAVYQGRFTWQPPIHAERLLWQPPHLPARYEGVAGAMIVPLTPDVVNGLAQAMSGSTTYDDVIPGKSI